MIEIMLTRGYIAFIDDDDADLAQFNWCADETRNGRVYAQRRTPITDPSISNHIRLHRVILERVLGRSLAKNELPNHIDDNPLNNTWSNLRIRPKVVRPSVTNKDGTITIFLTQGQVTLIDAIDSNLADVNWIAHFDKLRVKEHCYTAQRITRGDDGKRKGQSLHRIILARMLNRELLNIEEVDHKNLDPLDNRRSNLRLATSSQNKTNQSKHQSNTSGFKGICWISSRGKWIAKIRVSKRVIYLGEFDTPEKAHEAYCEAAIKYHGEFARLE